MQEIVAKEAKVKEELVEEVVEVEVEETVEEKVKEEVEEKGVEEKVKEEVEEKGVEEKAAGAGKWLTVFRGAKEAGSIHDPPWDPTVVAGPHPPNLDHHLLVPPESRIWTPRSLMHRVHHKILGQVRWVWADKGGPPGQTPGGGGVCRRLVVATGVSREEGGVGAPPPLRKRGEEV